MQYLLCLNSEFVKLSVGSDCPYQKRNCLLTLLQFRFKGLVLVLHFLNLLRNISVCLSFCTFRRPAHIFLIFRSFWNPAINKILLVQTAVILIAHSLLSLVLFHILKRRTILAVKSIRHWKALIVLIWISWFLNFSVICGYDFIYKIILSLAFLLFKLGFAFLSIFQRVVLVWKIQQRYVACILSLEISAIINGIFIIRGRIRCLVIQVCTKMVIWHSHDSHQRNLSSVNFLKYSFGLRPLLHILLVMFSNKTFVLIKGSVISKAIFLVKSDWVIFGWPPFSLYNAFIVPFHLIILLFLFSLYFLFLFLFDSFSLLDLFV